MPKVIKMFHRAVQKITVAFLRDYQILTIFGKNISDTNGH